MPPPRRGRNTTDHLAFLQVLLRAPARTGALLPSSVHLARAMVDGLLVGPGDTIVEFGPGTGAFTVEIDRILPSKSAYLGIEIEPRFVEILRRRHPDLLFVQGSAEDAPRLLAEAGCGRVKAIVCGLPFASLAAGVQDRIVRALDLLVQPGVQFRTFAYVHAYGLPPAIRFRRRMRVTLGAETRESLVLRNLPPAYVLRWSR